MPRRSLSSTVLALAGLVVVAGCEEKKPPAPAAPPIGIPPPPSAPEPVPTAAAPAVDNTPKLNGFGELEYPDGRLADPPGVTTVCPAEMAPIPIGGCIDRYEASSSKGELGGYDGLTTTVVAESVPGRMPLRDVSHAQARRACENAKKHLCTEAEWRSGCKNRVAWRRPDVHAYPYGHKFEGGKCNDWTASDQGKKGAVPTGSFAGCVTPTGAFDLSGNVGELVDTLEHGGYAAHGGSYYHTVLDTCCDEDDDAVKPGAHRPDIGFRCCSDGKKQP